MLTPHDHDGKSAPTEDMPAQAAEAVEMSRLDEQRHAYERQHPLEKPTSDPEVEIIDWDGPNDPENPFNWPRSRKILITVVALIGTFSVLTNGTAITVAAEQINEEFGISDARFPNSYWPVTSWTLGGSLFMLILLPITEDIGVRYSYLASYALFLVFVIPQALANSFATLIVVRFIAGGFVSLVANFIASVICDIWQGDQGRANPMAAYITMYLVGSSIGPVIGAAVLEFLPWRWILWVQLIWYGALFPVFFFVIKETRGSVILRARAKKIRETTGKNAITADERDSPRLLDVVKISVQRPVFMFCTEYVVFTFTLWSAFSVGLVYLFTQSTAQVFTELYDWPVYSTGYVQGAIVIGEILGLPVWVIQKRLYFASASRNTERPGTPIPEARLYLSIPAGLIGMCGGMFVYAWTSYASVPWIAPAIGLVMVGVGVNVVVIAIAEYVTDCYSKYAASAVAAVAAGENIFAAFLPLAASSMYTTLGFNWASSILAFFALVLAMAPVVLLIWGRAIRARSPFILKASYDLYAEEREEGPAHV